MTGRGYPMLEYPRRTDPIRRWAESTPDALALVDPASGIEWSYDEFDAEIEAGTAELSRLGVGPGDRVATLLPTRAAHVTLFFAANRRGAALVPLNWRLAGVELAPILTDADPALLVTDGSWRELAATAVAESTLDPPPPVLDLDRERPGRPAAGGGLDGAGNPESPVEVPSPEAPAMVLYTSGTTGRPKGAILPHRQLHANAVATCAAWGIGPDDVLPVTTPLFHTGGWNVLATPGWHAGSTVVLMEGFDPDHFLGTLDRHGCTLALVVPTQLFMMVAGREWGRIPSRLRAFVSGGAPCPVSLARTVREAGYRLMEGYGLTECGPNCFHQTPEESEAAPGWVGRPIDHLEMRLQDEEGRTVTGPGRGELQLRGPQLFGGYLNDPRRTAEAFSEGWLRTGDVADRSHEGRYRICGRIKEMFISGGENVYPAEVEAVLLDHPGVEAVAVVARPDEKWGEIGCAWVVPSPGAEPTAAELRAFVRERLAGYKVPKAMGFLEMLPTLGSGKVDRSALAALQPAPPA